MPSRFDATYEASLRADEQTPSPPTHVELHMWRRMARIAYDDLKTLNRCLQDERWKNFAGMTLKDMEELCHE